MPSLMVAGLEFETLGELALDDRECGAIVACRLPDPLVLEILKFAVAEGGGCVLLAASKVCRQFNRLCRENPSLWVTCCHQLGISTSSADGAGAAMVSLSSHQLRRMFVERLTGSSSLKLDRTSIALRWEGKPIISQAPNTVLRGDVLVRVVGDAPLLLEEGKALEVRVQGIESALQHTGGDDGYSEKKYSYINQSIELPVAAGGLLPGLHVFPFCIRFPSFGPRGEVLPPSTRVGSSLTVSYSLSAKLFVRSHKVLSRLWRDLKTSVPLQVISSPSSFSKAVASADVEQTVRRRSLLFGRIAVRVKFCNGTPVAGCQGHRLVAVARLNSTELMSVSIINDTGKPISHVRTQILLKLKQRDADHISIHSTHVKGSIVDVDLSQYGGVIPPRSTATRQVPLLVPQEGIPPVESTKFMKIFYSASVTARVGTLACCCEVPLSIVM